MTTESSLPNADLDVALPTNWETIEAELRHYTGDVPILALMAATRLADDITPHLLAELDACAEYPMQRIDDEDGWMLHLNAVLLLGVLRVPAALTPLLTLLRLENDLLEELLGDNITDIVPRALAAICPVGEEAALFDFAHDSSVSFWARSAALQALTIRAFEGDLPRATLHAWLLQESAAEAERMRSSGEEPVFGETSGYLTALVLSLEEIGAADQIENVSNWYAQGLIDTVISTNEQSETHLLRDFETCKQEDMPEGLGYPRDAVVEAERWAAFADSEDGEDFSQTDDFDQDPFADDDWSPEPPKPFVRDGAKVGRNDSCPCGSGAKFKRCCGA